MKKSRKIYVNFSFQVHDFYNGNFSKPILETCRLNLTYQVVPKYQRRKNPLAEKRKIFLKKVDKECTTVPPSHFLIYYLLKIFLFIYHLLKIFLLDIGATLVGMVGKEK